MQSENLNIPVQKNKYQNKNIYFSTKIFISVPKNIFHSKNIYFSTKIFISVQKYLFQYQNIYFSPKIFISVPKYIFQPKNIYFSTKIYISIQKYLFQYKKKKSFPKSRNISQVSLRPAGRREVILSKWRIWMDIQKEANTYYFKKLHIRNYISLLWKVSRYQNPKCNANLEKSLVKSVVLRLRRRKRIEGAWLWWRSTHQDVALLHQERTWRAWLTTCCNFFVNIPLP